MSDWISVEDRMPSNGVYQVKLIGLDLKKSITKRKLINGKWFGGVRPFSEKETVTHWRED